jgi:eukaryotic-like serine/threonine-protein kinase
MVASKYRCDTESIERMLQGQFDHQEIITLERHIAECPTCHAAISTLSGGEDFAAQAKSHLPIRSWQLRSHTHDDEPSLPFLQPSPNPKFIGQLGRYGIESVLGRGGCGVVLKGWDSDLNRYVAIKVLISPLLHSATAKQRLLREAQAAAAITHDSIVPIHAVESEGATPYLVLGYVGGPSLEQSLEMNGTIDPIRVVRIALQIAQGLAAAHACGVIHRDIKPGNILLCDELDRIKIADFGLARVMDDVSQTQSGLITGTPQFMSPEQARGESVDPSSDLFSLGSVMYAMCCGHGPFRAETTLGVIRRICDDKPRDIRCFNPSVPPELAGIMHKLLAKEKGDRFESAQALADLLQSYATFLQQPLAGSLPAHAKLELHALARSVSKEVSPKRPLVSSWHLRATATLLVCGACAWLLAFVGWSAFNDPSWYSVPRNATSVAKEPNNPPSLSKPDDPINRELTAEGPSWTAETQSIGQELRWLENRSIQRRPDPLNSYELEVQSLEQQLRQLENPIIPFSENQP